MTDWEDRWSTHARIISAWSKDRSRGVGCVIVGPDNEIRSQGFNGFPRGVDDDVDARHARPAKYLYTEHAERNAIYNAARVGVPLKGCTLYVSTLHPCAVCARAMIQAGIKRVVCAAPGWDETTWLRDFEVAREILLEAGVEIKYL